MRRIIAILLSLLICLTFSMASVAETAIDENIIHLDLNSADDAELAAAIQKIRDEQKARLKVTISFDVNELSIGKGASQRIAVSINNMPEDVKAGKYTWESADPSIATCKNGVVKAIEKGKTTITCSVTLSNDITLSAECSVEVYVPAKSIKVNEKNIEVMVGDYINPTILFSPEDTTDQGIAFSSSDETIAKVDESGKALALSVGKVKITASTIDGSNKKVTFPVTVTKKVGRYDDELTFQGVPWDTDYKTACKMLEDAGLSQKDSGYYPSYVKRWIYLIPEKEEDFIIRLEEDNLSGIFEDKQTGVFSIDLNETETKVGGESTSMIILSFVNGIKRNQIDKDKSLLKSIYIRFSTDDESGQKTFINLLNKLEAQYGEFSYYFNKRSMSDLKKKIPDIYNLLKSNAKTIDGGKKYIAYYPVMCILHGKNNTAIVLRTIFDGSYTELYYGKTDSYLQINELQTILENQPDTILDTDV